MTPRLPLAWLGWATIVVLVTIVYAPGLDGGFVSDDRPLVAENPFLRDASAIPGFFTRGAWASSGLALPGDRVYRPGFLLWLFAIHAVAGANAFAFHLAPLLLHCINAGLVLAVCRRLWPRAGIGAATLAAAVFALHPAQTEVVAWIAGSTDALLGGFLLGGLLAWLRYRDGDSALWGILAGAALIAALAVKETAVAAPVAVLLLDRLRPARRRLCLAYVVMAALLVAYLLARHAALGGAPPLSISAAGVLRLLEYVALCGRYVLAPWPLPFWFEHPSTGVAPAELALGAGAILLGTLAAWRLPACRFPLAWFALLSLPPLAVAFSDSGAFALRFLYLPLAGVAWALAAALRVPMPRRAVVGAVAPALLVGGAWIAAVRAVLPGFHDEVRFFQRVIASDPLGASGPNGLAESHRRQGDVAAALGVYQAALQRMPHGDARIAMLEGIALLHAGQGRYHESLATYSQMLSSPRHAGLGHYGMGNSLWALGRLREALQAYRRAVSEAPDLFDAQYNLGALSEQLGLLDEAAAAYARALDLPGAARNPQARAHARAFLHARTRARQPAAAGSAGGG